MLHFLLEKSEKNSKFLFFEKCFQMASNDSKWVPKHPPDPKTSFGSPHASYGPKKIEKNRFWDLKFHFSSFKALRAWKNAFLSKIQRTKLFSRLYFITHHARGPKYRTKWKDLSIRFLIKDLFFEKSHFLHPHAQKSSQNIRKSFIFCLKKIQNFRFS